MLWEYIRDFLVQNIFGGFDSNLVEWGGLLGVNPDTMQDFGIDSVGYAVGTDIYSGEPAYIGLGDWLSTTCTIIIMVTIVILFALLVRWVFKLVTSTFLLR